MTKIYLINEDQHDALIRAARFGKDCPELTELERVMCQCAEMDLDKVTRALEYNKKVYVAFFDSEVKIPALSNSWRYFIGYNLGDEFLSRLFKNFPDFDNEIEVHTEACGSYYTFDNKP